MMKTYTMKEGHSAGKTNMTSSIPKKKKKTLKYKNEMMNKMKNRDTTQRKKRPL